MIVFDNIKGSVASVKQSICSHWKEFRQDLEESNSWMKVGVAAFIVYLLIAIVMGFYWSFEPDQFSVREKALLEVGHDEKRLVTGAMTTASLIHVVDVMIHRRGGYLSNDRLPPGLWLDNMPNWEYGVLIQTRDLAKAMREAFSRSQSQSLEDKDLALVESQFNFDNNVWLLPSTEGQYEEGIELLRKYLARLTDEDAVNAQFYARSDNLRYWLRTVETRLGSMSQRLSASVGQRRLNTDLAGDPGAAQATKSAREVEDKTSWFQIDNEFYKVRGSAWALIHFLKAIEIDFDDILTRKNAKVSVQQIIRELEGTQQAVFSPVILNGSGFGLRANHSLVMASYISRAHAAIIDLRELLSQG